MRAIEERNSQNANQSNQAQVPCQRIIRTPYGTIIATNNTTNARPSVQQQPATATTAPNRSIVRAPTIGQPIMYRQQVPRSGARDALMTYRMIRCCIVIVVAIVVAIAAGIGASQHSSDTDDDYYSSSSSGKRNKKLRHGFCLVATPGSGQLLFCGVSGFFLHCGLLGKIKTCTCRGMVHGSWLVM